MKSLILATTVLMLSGCADQSQLEWPGQTYMIEADIEECTIYNPTYTNLSDQAQSFTGTFILLDKAENTIETKQITCDEAIPHKATHCRSGWELSEATCSQVHDIKMVTQRN